MESRYVTLFSTLGSDTAYWNSLKGFTTDQVKSSLKNYCSQKGFSDFDAVCKAAREENIPTPAVAALAVDPLAVAGIVVSVISWLFPLTGGTGRFDEPGRKTGRTYR